jgi:Fe-S cluster assembly protein SufD
MEKEIKLGFEKSINQNNFSNTQIEIKKENLEKFIDKGFPTKRLEDWKFSDLNQIISANFEKLNFFNSKSSYAIQSLKLIEDFENNKIVFVNGKISEIDFQFENKEQIIIEQNKNFDKEESDNSLLSLNSAFNLNYIKISVKKGYKSNKPLVIYNYLTDEIDSAVTNIRLDLNLDDNSSLDVLQVSNKNVNKNFINICQKFDIAQNAILKNYILDNENTKNIKYIYNNFNLSKNSHLEYFILSEGSKFIKHDVICSLNKNYGSISLNGVINLNDKKHHEIKTIINHNDENCKSYQLIKNVLNDESKGVYQGKIFVNSKAQKTDGYQLSRALLLNDKAEFNAKPELEIYADDVKCSHGSTSGSLDENSIFYLMSRGLDYNQSRQLLINGFLQEVIEKITNKEIKLLVEKITKIIQ